MRPGAFTLTITPVSFRDDHLTERICRPVNILFDSATRHEYLRSAFFVSLAFLVMRGVTWSLDPSGHKAVVCAISASYVSTFAGYPVSITPAICAIYSPKLRTPQLDSIKSRLQTTRNKITIPRLAFQVYREEGIIGFYRGLWIPLMTISFVRTYPRSLMPIAFQ